MRTYVTAEYDEMTSQIRAIQKQVEAFAASLKSSLGLQSVYLSLRGNDLILDNLIVPKDKRNQGIGSQAMKAISDFADRNGMRLVLTPGVRDPKGQGTTSRNRLVRFYRRFGLIPNKGRNKDFSISEGMLRPVSSPQPPQR